MLGLELDLLALICLYNRRLSIRLDLLVIVLGGDMFALGFRCGTIQVLVHLVFRR